MNAISGSSSEQIQAILRVARRYLAMDVGFVSEFVQDDRVFRYTDAAHEGNPIQIGASDPLEKSFCHYIAQGLIPSILTDASLDAVAATLPVTKAIPVGAHLSVPLRYPDGTPFGSLCCFSFTPNQGLNSQDLGVLRMCADVVSAVLEQERRASSEAATRKARIKRLIDTASFDMAFQPIYQLATGRLLGFEALSRFPTETSRAPDVWFAEAEAVGLGLDLEYLACRKALEALSVFDESLRITVNLSPQAIVSPRFADVFAAVPVERVVVEMTEHAVVEDYDALRTALAVHRQRGLRLAIDDVGAGHSTFRHILDLSPELVKLDRTLIHGLHRDSARRALAEALTMYGRRIGCEVIAEGVEDAADLAVMGEIGITRVQGFLLGRPMPLDAARDLPLTRIL
jgi:EAL domain-containing protein (putative c-di-GMP-specific phosphodiesterase class I)